MYRITSIGLGACLAIASLVACTDHAGAGASYGPPPAPLCDMSRGEMPEKARRMEALLTQMGELDAMAAHEAQVRQRIEGVISKGNPAAAAPLRPTLDEFFSTGMLHQKALCDMAVTLRMSDIEAMEAWSRDPVLLQINAAVRDQAPDPQANAASLPPERRDLLLRLVYAMHLQERLLTEIAAARHVEFTTYDALIPSASTELDDGINGRWRNGPTAEFLVDAWAAPALEKFNDRKLARFLAATEQEGPKRFFANRSVVDSHQNSAWYARLVKSIAARAPAPTRMPQSMEDKLQTAAMVSEARRLLHENGTRVVIADARTLLLRAEKADPRNAEIKVLLGEIALETRPAQPVGRDDIRAKSYPQHFAQAEKYLNQALALDPSSAQARILLGRSAFLQGRDDEAEAWYERAEKDMPDHPWREYNHGDLAFVRGDLDSAISSYKSGLAKPEREAYVHYRLLHHLRIALRKQDKSGEFTAIGDDYLGTHPDAWDFRFDFADHLLEVDAPAKKILAVIDPIPEPWLPGMKHYLEARALVQQAAQDSGNRRIGPKEKIAVRRAIELTDPSESLIRQLCLQPHHPRAIDVVVQASEAGKTAVNEAFACSMRLRDIPLMDRMVALGADIDAPMPMHEGEIALCQTIYSRNFDAFERLLEAGADTTRHCRDGTAIPTLLRRLQEHDRDNAPKMQSLLERLQASTQTSG